MFAGRYGYRETGLIVPRDQAEVRVAAPDADIVLDPVCGSGTAAVAASEACRRFIVIDRNPVAIETTFDRLSPHVRRRTARVEWLKDRHEFARDPMLWDCGWNFAVRADAIACMRSMPDSFVALVVADPPFNAGREFRNAEGEGFSDIWRWDAAAEERLEEIGRMPEDRFASSRAAVLLTIEACREMGSGDRASYLTWMTLLLVECRRVMGSWEPATGTGQADEAVS